MLGLVAVFKDYLYCYRQMTRSPFLQSKSQKHHLSSGFRSVVWQITEEIQYSHYHKPIPFIDKLFLRYFN